MIHGKVESSGLASEFQGGTSAVSFASWMVEIALVISDDADV